MIQIEGYSLVLQDRAEGRGGGVALYIRQRLAFTTIDILATTQNAISFRLQGINGSHLTGLLIYRFPKSNRELFYKELANNISDLGENAIIMGDINIDLFRVTESAAYSNLLSSMGFTSHMNQPTREVFPYSTCIDHVHFRSKVKVNIVAVKDCFAKPTRLSDHHAVVIRLRGLTHQLTFASVNKKHTIKFINWDALNTSLLGEDWNSLLSGNNVNEMFATFYRKLSTLLAKNIKFIKKSSCKIKRNPWASELLVRLAKQKNDLYLLIKKHPDNDYLKSQYKKLSQKVQQQTISDKKDYFGDLLEDSGLNSRKYWQVVGKVTGTERKGIDIIQINSIHDGSQNQLLVANEFNNYFTGVTQKLAAKIRDPKAPQISKSPYANLLNPSPHSFFMYPITPSEIINAVKAISNKNSVGTDGVGSEVLKNCMYGLLAPLGILFNLSVTEGVFPNLLKTAIIVPVFKSGLQSELSNYRPIAILLVISKLLELIVKN